MMLITSDRPSKSNNHKLDLDTGKTVDVCSNEEHQTVWLTQRQMAELFDKDVRTINGHVLNAYDEQGLYREPTLRKFRRVGHEGVPQIAREIECYKLDAIISVGYRVNSRRAVRFRQWATRVLRERLPKARGCTSNASRRIR
ncbi:RhuM family protein [Salinicola halophyticus]|uniref:RhuM family protein n=1 Tax=Salinicola halophyticus TaxID=1808881 RepID=UPI003F464DA2